MSETDSNIPPLSLALCKIFYDGVDECEYKKIQDTDEPDVPSGIITSYYDANDVLRKEIYSRHKYIDEMKLYNANGELSRDLYIALSDDKIIVYLEDYEDYNNDHSNKVKSTEFTLAHKEDYAVERRAVYYIDGD